MNYKTIKIDEQEYYLVPKTTEKIDLSPNLNIEEEIRNSSNNIDNKIQFYRHMNDLDRKRKRMNYIHNII